MRPVGFIGPARESEVEPSFITSDLKANRVIIDAAIRAPSFIVAVASEVEGMALFANIIQVNASVHGVVASHIDHLKLTTTLEGRAILHRSRGVGAIGEGLGRLELARQQVVSRVVGLQPRLVVGQTASVVQEGCDYELVLVGCTIVEDAVLPVSDYLSL